MHHPILGMKLKERMEALGLECHLNYEGSPKRSRYRNQSEFIVEKLNENGGAVEKQTRGG